MDGAPQSLFILAWAHWDNSYWWWWWDGLIQWWWCWFMTDCCHTVIPGYLSLHLSLYLYITVTQERDQSRREAKSIFLKSYIIIRRASMVYKLCIERFTFWDMLASNIDMTWHPTMFSLCLSSSLDTWDTRVSSNLSSLSISLCWATCAAPETVNLTRSGCWLVVLARVVAGDDEGEGDATDGDEAGAGAGAEVVDTFLVDVLDFWTVEVGTSESRFVLYVIY